MTIVKTGSHKRATAQHIAGRMFESFKEDYKVFLDSEVQFDVHDLEVIVSNTGNTTKNAHYLAVFVWILSEGYFQSEFCMKELASAIQNKKKVKRFIFSCFTDRDRERRALFLHSRGNFGESSVD